MSSIRIVTRDLADEKAVAYRAQTVNPAPGKVQTLSTGAGPPRLRPQEEAPGGDDELTRLQAIEYLTRQDGSAFDKAAAQFGL